MSGARVQMYGRNHHPGGADRIPGPWIEATLESGITTPSGKLPLQYRDSGLGVPDFWGAVEGDFSSPPVLLTTLDPTLVELSFSDSVPVPATGGHDWELDPDGKLWVVT